MEIVLVMGAAFAVFLLFFLVFAIKKRDVDEPVHIHNCHNCSCGKKESGHLDRFRAQAEEGVGTDRHVGDARENRPGPS